MGTQRGQQRLSRAGSCTHEAAVISASAKYCQNRSDTLGRRQVTEAHGDFSSSQPQGQAVPVLWTSSVFSYCQQRHNLETVFFQIQKNTENGYSPAEYSSALWVLYCSVYKIHQQFCVMLGFHFHPVHSIILPAYKTAATLFISCSIMKSILLWCHWFDRRYSGATVPSLAQEGNFSHLTLLTLNKPFWSNEYSSFLETTKLSVAPSKLTWSTSIVSGGGSYFHLLLALYFCAALWISGTHLP